MRELECTGTTEQSHLKGRDWAVTLNDLEEWVRVARAISTKKFNMASICGSLP